MMQRTLLLFVLALLLLSFRMVVAQSSTNYSTPRFVLVGGGSAGSAHYAVTAVFGQPVTRVASSPSYKVAGGFLHPQPQGTFTVGGTVSGLAGSGLVLQNNGGDDLLVEGNGDITFATALADGSAYAVSIKTQPTNPVQNCIVTNGAGTLAGSAVTNIKVTCAAPAQRKDYLPFIER